MYLAGIDPDESFDFKSPTDKSDLRFPSSDVVSSTLVSSKFSWMVAFNLYS